MYNLLDYIPKGWQCPVCKRVYSPSIPVCSYCGDAVTKTNIEPSDWLKALQEANEIVESADDEDIPPITLKLF